MQVTRDLELENWAYAEPGCSASRVFGSGYPGGKTGVAPFVVDEPRGWPHGAVTSLVCVLLWVVGLRVVVSRWVVMSLVCVLL